MKIYDLLVQNWTSIVVPLTVFFFCLMTLLWLRNQAVGRLTRWFTKVKWLESGLLHRLTKWPFFILCFSLSACFGIAASPVSANWKIPVEHSLLTVVVFSIVLAVLTLVNSFILDFKKRLKLPGSISNIRNISCLIVIAFAVLVVLAIWGIPTIPLLLLIGVAGALILMTLRDLAPNFFSGLHLMSEKHIKVGDFIKLESGEEGFVTKMGWTVTELQTPGGDNIIIPNSQFTRQRVIKIGHFGKKKSNIGLSSLLTAREIEIAVLISHGATNKDIANKLIITENTAKVHVKNIFKKLGLKSRQQLDFPNEEVLPDT